MFDCFDANETGRILLRCSMNTDIDIEINFFFYRDDAKIFDLDKRIQIITKEKERKKKRLIAMTLGISVEFSFLAR